MINQLKQIGRHNKKRDYGRYQRKRKEDNHQGWLLITGKDVGKGKHVAGIII